MKYIFVIYILFFIKFSFSQDISISNICNIPYHYERKNYYYLLFGTSIIGHKNIILGVYEIFNRFYLKENIIFNFRKDKYKNLYIELIPEFKGGYIILQDYLQLSIGIDLNLIYGITTNYFKFKPIININIESENQYNTSYFELGINYNIEKKEIEYALGLGYMFKYDFLNTNYLLVDYKTKQTLLINNNESFKEFYSNNTMLIYFSFFNYPFNNMLDYINPSMKQSLEICYNFSLLIPNILFLIIDKINLPFAYLKIGENNILITPLGTYYKVLDSFLWQFQFLFSFLPFGYIWLHEEWHRAVLNKYKIDSYNEIYDFKSLEFISVSHIKDEDLIFLKHNFPNEMIRLAEAGNEANLELTHKLNKYYFVYNNFTFLYVLSYYFINNFNSVGYLLLNSLGRLDNDTMEIISNEGTNIMIRDALGMDFTAWVYDLFRPDEPYTNRGIHPSGEGIKRYILTTDLTEDELNFLQLQGFLSLINLLNPQLIINHFEFKNPFNQKSFLWNFSFIHHLTCFGFDIVLNLFFKQDNINLFFAFHNYFNKNNYFPGIELELYEYPINIFDYQITFSGTLHGWLQPTGLSFYTNEAKPGGYISMKVNFPLFKHFGIFIEGNAKTEGWKAGNVHLDPAIEASSGISIMW